MFVGFSLGSGSYFDSEWDLLETEINKSVLRWLLSGILIGSGLAIHARSPLYYNLVLPSTDGSNSGSNYSHS